MLIAHPDNHAAGVTERQQYPSTAPGALTASRALCTSCHARRAFDTLLNSLEQQRRRRFR